MDTELNGLIYSPGILSDPQLKAMSDAQIAEYNREVNEAPKHKCLYMVDDSLVIFWQGKWELWANLGDGDDCQHDIAHCPYCGQKLGVT